MPFATNRRTSEMEEHEILAEALLNLPPDAFDEIDEIMSRLAGQLGSDDVLSDALKKLEPALAMMIDTMAYTYKNDSNLEAIRKWLLYGWPIMKDYYKSRKEN